MSPAESSPPVTWLLPVRNGMPYLTETLASIEAQTFRNWTVLAWDNGSTDDTVDELRRWIPSRIPGIVVSESPTTLGQSLREMVSMAETEFCARIDADDLSDPTRLEKQVAFLLSNPGVAVVGSQFGFIDRDGYHMPGAWAEHIGDADIRWGLRWHNTVTHVAVLMRRSVILGVGNYRDLMPYEDHELWLRVGNVAEFANLPDRLVQVRRHANNVTVDRDYGPGFRRAAEHNSKNLFHGLPPQRAMELRHLAAHDSHDRVTLADMWEFHRAAGLAAEAVGKPTAYFRRTALYQVQQRALQRRWLERFAAGRSLLRLKRFLASLRGT